MATQKINQSDYKKYGENTLFIKSPSGMQHLMNKQSYNPENS